MSKNIDKNNIAKEISTDKMSVNIFKTNSFIKNHPVISFIIVLFLVIILLITVIISTTLTHKNRSAYGNYKTNYEIRKNIDDISHNNRKYCFNQFATSNTVTYNDYIIGDNLDDVLTIETLAQNIPTNDAIQILTQITGNNKSYALQFSNNYSSIYVYKINDKINRYYCDSNSNWKINIFTNQENYIKAYGSLPINDSSQNISVYYSYNQKICYERKEKYYDSNGNEINSDIIDDYFYVTAIQTKDYITVIEFSSIVYPEHLSTQAKNDRLLLINLIEFIC